MTKSIKPYAMPIALLAAIILAPLLAILPFRAPTAAPHIGTATYYQRHYSCQHSQCLPLPKVSAPAIETLSMLKATMPTKARILVKMFPGVGDQGPQGACAAWTTAWALSYEWRIQHPGSWIRFSPRQMYDHFSNTYNSGLDGGSWPNQDAEISSTTGLLTFNENPYPPYQMDRQEIPTVDAFGRSGVTDAAQHKFSTLFTSLQGYTDGGQQPLIDNIRYAITQGFPVLIGFPVYPEYDNATAQPNIVGPSNPSETSRGGHSNTILGYDDTRLMPDGTRGAFLIQNQWGRGWGIHGRAWMAYSFVRAYAFGTEVPMIEKNSAKTKVPKIVGPADGGHSLVPPPLSTPHQRPHASGSWYVNTLYAHDRPGYNLAPLFNYWGDHFNVPPIGLAATFGSECGLNTGVGGDCNRIVYPNDISGGGCQITVGTAQSIGVGDGSNSNANINYVFNWEDNPANCIWGEASIMHSYSSYRNNATYPLLNILWNCGPATTSYPIPYGQCATNFYGDFLGWYNYMVSNYGMTYKPPPPPTFPATLWNKYRRAHHLRTITHTYKGHLAHGANLWWQYGASKAGGVVSPERFYKRRHHSFMTQRFQYRRLYWWPGTSWGRFIAVHPIQ